MRWAAMLALALYGCAVVAAPALHHDFLCHLKGPAHCTACAADGPASRPVPAVAVVTPPPAPVLQVEHGDVAPHDLDCPIRPAGRAPPLA